jgi:hypothetical protein
MVERPNVCPFCGDNTLALLPGAELIATNTPTPHIVSRAEIFHCSAWHIFATFARQLDRVTADTSTARQTGH